MYKILFVDDDEIILEGMEKVIDWAGNGFQIVGKATNGLEGFELVKEFYPQIIVSDINMPYMDGLELAEKVGLHFPLIKIIFLTGYDEGKYARKAIELKANSYILKYSSYDEILDAVKRARDEIEKEKEIKALLDKGKALQREKFCNELIHGISNNEIIEQEARFLDIDLFSGKFCVAVISSGKSSAEEKMDEGAVASDFPILPIQKTVESLLIMRGNGIAFTNTNNQVCIIFQILEADNESYELIANILEEIINAAKTILRADIKIGVGGVYEKYSEVYKSYNEAVNATVVTGHQYRSGIIHFDSLKSKEHSHGAVIKKVISFINENYHNTSLSLDEISREVYVSPAYISTLFKKLMDINLNEYINNIRIEEAKRLLVCTDLKTYEISERVGYSNPHYFSFAFKRQTLMSPKEYRKNVKNI